MSAEIQPTGNINLKKQDLAQLDVTTLTPLSPEVISRQATINIGTIGHVAHGKSTVVKAVSGVHTVRFKNELERNITIKLERLTVQQMEEITSSTDKLREFVKEVNRKYPRSPYSMDVPSSVRSKSKKRRASKPLNSVVEKRSKYPKWADLLGMTVQQALQKDFFSTPNHIPMTNFDSTSSVNGDTASVHSMASTSSSSNRNLSMNADVSEGDMEPTPIEMNLSRLFALYKLEMCKGQLSTKNIEKLEKDSSKKQKEKKQKGVQQEEYVVQQVIEMEWARDEPKYKILWKGYHQTTWEPVNNIYDCNAYREFTAKFVQKNKHIMEQLWEQMQATIVAESLQPNVSNAVILNQIENFDYYEFQSYFFMLTAFRTAIVEEDQIEYGLVYDRVMCDMKFVEYYFRRLDQLQSIHGWVQIINEKDKSKNLRVENFVDFELPPIHDFEYTNDVIPREGVEIPDDPPVGCFCAEDGGDCSKKSNCCPNAFDAKFAYRNDGRIRVPQGTPVFECNKRCKCSDKCHNRVVQKGRNQSLCIFKTVNGRGWGVRTERPIAKGAYICEYVGEVITNEEGDRRGKQYDIEGRTYLFDLDFNEENNKYVVDAANYGNVSRFLNHSCDPNVGVWAVWTDCLDLNLPKLCLFTLRSIKENEELTFDYTNFGGTQNDSENEATASIASKESTSKANGSFSNEENDEDLNDVMKNENVNGTYDDCDNDQIIQTITVDSSSDEENDDDVMMKSPKPKINTEQDGFDCRCGATKCRKIIFC